MDDDVESSVLEMYVKVLSNDRTNGMAETGCGGSWRLKMELGMV